MNALILLLGALLLLVAFVRYPLPNRYWLLLATLALAAFTLSGGFSWTWGLLAWGLWLGPVLLLSVPDWRRRYLSKPLIARIRKMLPPMSQTERDAIESGTVGWEAELFRGNPDWKRLLSMPRPRLSEEERAFIDGPVEELCRRIDDWDITHNRKDLPPEMWDFLKQNRFFGMIIPKRYGGLEFSATAHSEVVMKVSARSISVGVTVMVPNSLGPAELLLHYGTDEQRDYYLPRLADGREIPCFALTAPEAGSDAGAIPDSGVVCEGDFEGKKVLGLRLNWNKRYITLGPVATVLGIAFKAYDPDHLLGDEEELGITCALVPTNLPGIEIGERHFPLNAAFMNGPNRGRDVFVPLDFVIGGREMIGKGWRMLVESLSAGRGISLPAVGTGAGKLAVRATGAYARIRKQFKIPIGRFEGVEEALARMGGLTYFMDAGRLLTLSALDRGEKPSVITAILKYHNTEKMRQVVNDAMDVHGGRGICMGPNNYLGRGYQTLPVGITVEGANILTRSMIIFGQGAIRCHPWLVREIESAGENDLESFDRALAGHVGYFVGNLARAFVYGLSGSHLAPRPFGGRTGRYFQRLAQMSAAFAVIADVSLMLLGGAFKRKEKLSGRFADALSYQFYASAILKKFEDDGRPRADLPLVEWSVKYCLYQTQHALDEILRNFPSKPLGLLLRLAVFPLGLSLRQPNDFLGHRVAALVIRPGAVRDRLTRGIFLSMEESDITGRLEVALRKVIAAEPVEKRLRAAGQVKPERQDWLDWYRQLREQGVIDEEDEKRLREAREATLEVIAVDAFEPGELEGLDRSGRAEAA